MLVLGRVLGQLAQLLRAVGKGLEQEQEQRQVRLMQEWMLGLVLPHLHADIDMHTDAVFGML